MALSKNISNEAFERLSILDKSKYKSLFKIIAHAKNLNTAIVTDDAIDLPFDRAIANPDRFVLDLGVKLSGKQYAVFKHDENTFYVVVPLMDSRKFKVLFDGDYNAVTLTGTLEAQPANDFLIGGNGPFFGTGQYFRDLTGKAFSSGSQVNITTGAATSTKSLQWNSAASGQPPLHLQFMDQAEATGGEGISSLPPLVWKKVKIAAGATDSGYYQDCIDSPKKSRHIVAYKIANDFFFDIAYKNKNGNGIEIDKIANALVALEVDYAVFFDGSDSVYLWEYHGPGGGRPVVDDLGNEKSIALDVCYAIKKTQL